MGLIVGAKCFTNAFHSFGNSLVLKVFKRNSKIVWLVSAMNPMSRLQSFASDVHSSEAFVEAFLCSTPDRRPVIGGHWPLFDPNLFFGGANTLSHSRLDFEPTECEICGHVADNPKNLDIHRLAQHREEFQVVRLDDAGVAANQWTATVTHRQYTDSMATRITDRSYRSSERRERRPKNRKPWSKPRLHKYSCLNEECGKVFDNPGLVHRHKKWCQYKGGNVRSGGHANRYQKQR